MNVWLAEVNGPAPTSRYVPTGWTKIGDTTTGVLVAFYGEDGYKYDVPPGYSCTIIGKLTHEFAPPLRRMPIVLVPKALLDDENFDHAGWLAFQLERGPVGLDLLSRHTGFGIGL